MFSALQRQRRALPEAGTIFFYGALAGAIIGIFSVFSPRLIEYHNGQCVRLLLEELPQSFNKVGRLVESGDAERLSVVAGKAR